MEIKITNEMVLDKINENKILDEYIDTLESFIELEKEFDYGKKIEEATFHRTELICGKEIFYNHLRQLLYFAENLEFHSESEDLKYLIGKFNFMNIMLLDLIKKNIDFTYEESVAVYSVNKVTQNLYKHLDSIQSNLDTLVESIGFLKKN